MSITKISPDVVDFDAGITISTTDNSNNLTLTSTDADGNAGPVLDFYRNSASPAVGDLLGRINFRGRNDNSQDVDYAAWHGRIFDETDGTEDGSLRADIMYNGTVYDVFTLYGNEVVVNESSNDIDFRVESDGNAKALVILGDKYGLGVGRDPESAYNGYTSIELGQQGSILANDVADDLWFASNVYLDGSGNSKRKEAGVAALWQIDGDVISWYTAGSDSADTTISWSMKNRFSAAGNLSFNSGQGIDFSATGDVTGSASEVLDDYEEGIFAPTVGGAGGGSFGLSTNSDHLAYTKIGRQVTITGYLDITSDSSVSGSLRFSLPYACDNLADDAEYTMASLAVINNGSTKAGQKYIFAYSGSYAYLYYVQDSGAGAYFDHGDVDTAFQIAFNFSYFAAT